jgi:hypothetical protein
MDFSAIARRHQTARSSPFEERCCPDQFVGVISEIDRGGQFTCRVPATERPADLACVLLVLESPHTHEFDASPGPAKGTTGRNIVRYVSQVPGLIEKATFGLVLVNAVQYQCSLGNTPSDYRDAVFLDAWANGGRADFEERIRLLYRDGDCVVNCCTLGSSVDANLRVQVQRALTCVLPVGTKVLRRNHPSWWHVSGNRNREWAYAV